MPVEMIGWIAPRVSSEVQAAQGSAFDADVIAATARIHERADFDRALIGYFSDAPDGFLIGAHAASATQRLGLLLAHRPGFVSPTLAARKLATLDQLSNGRLAVHIIAGGSDADQAKDGDFTGHAGRYRRVREYIDLLRRTWTSTAPFDHAGEFYRVLGAYSDIRGLVERYTLLRKAGHPLQAEPAHSGLRGRRVERCDPGAGAACRSLHAVGRALARDDRIHGASQSGGHGRRHVPAAFQFVDAPDPCRDR